jgi:hypothetical protein
MKNLLIAIAVTTLFTVSAAEAFSYANWAERHPRAAHIVYIVSTPVRVMRAVTDAIIYAIELE